MLQGDELHDVHIIAAGFQKLSADAVGEQRREPLFDDAMLEHHLHAVILDLGEQLMLAAGNSEQDMAVPADGLDNGGIGCHIAGVQSDHHIDGLAGYIALNIAGEEGEAVIAQIPGHLFTEADDIVLEVQTDDLDIEPQLPHQIVIQSEGEIALAAAEVHDVDAPVLGQAVHAAGYQLQILVDLSELVIVGFEHMSVGIHHAEMDQKITGLPIGNGIGLLLVVGEVLFPGLGRRLGLDLQPAETGHVVVVFGGVQNALAEGVLQ